MVNVIEDPAERRETLKKAWSLARKVLIVAARTQDELEELSRPEGFSDGFRTKLDTFQKFYTQSELRTWIDEILSTASVAAAPGVFFVFRKEEQRQSYIASRYHRSIKRPRLRVSDKLYSEHQALLSQLEEFFLMRGRLPLVTEFPSHSEFSEIFGSLKKAFQVIQVATDKEQWKAVTAERKSDLTVYMALSRFDRSARWSALPVPIQLDVRSFYGTYKKAMKSANELLFGIGDCDTINRACTNSNIGKLTPKALYVHKTALNELSPLLRVYEGCGRGYLGEVDGANIIKIYRDEPKISYLDYPDFETDPHPRLRYSLNLNLSSFEFRIRRYHNQPNPPILHRKETFVSPSHPSHGKFSRLTAQENRHGLLDDGGHIGLLKGWEANLKKAGWALRGHRLIRSKKDQANPY